MTGFLEDQDTGGGGTAIEDPPTRETPKPKPTEPKVDVAELQKQAMLWIEGRCGNGPILVYITSRAAGSTDARARTFAKASDRSGSKPTFAAWNAPGVADKDLNQRIRSDGRDIGCSLVAVPKSKTDGFGLPQLLIRQDGTHSAIVLPRGVSSDFAKNWGLIFDKTTADADFKREIVGSGMSMEVKR